MSDLLYQQCKAMSDPALPAISSLANILAVLYHELEHCNWAGLYLYDEKDNILYLGPFQGKIACTKIPKGKGVVGTCAAKEESIWVEDVHLFEGHIACDSQSASELVCPVIKNGKLKAVLDLDFLIPSALEKDTIEQIQNVAHLIETL
jgi:GAF domain-containing protein